MVVVFGGLGGCLSHEFANMNALFDSSCPTILMSDTNMAVLLRPGRSLIRCPSGKLYCSLIPLDGPSKITATGLRWPLKDHTLQFGGLVSTSNETVSEFVEIDTSHPVLWVIDFKH
jgi:thiamine pyrophosphokinase